MNESEEKARSLARSPRGLSVAPSPFNAVKLDLALILVVALLLGLLHDRIVTGLGAQLLLLAGFAVAAAAWLIWRTRRVLQRETRKEQDGSGA